MSAPARLIALGACLAWAAGCSSETPSINPAPTLAADAAAQDAPSQPDAAVEAAAPREAGPVKRLVFERSPYGNLDRSGDLLMDPDFEWSTGRGQTGWVASSNAGQERVLIETGGICRSGLRCVRLEGTTILFGRATGATSSGAKLSLWAKVPADKCDLLNVYFVRAMSYEIVPAAFVAPVTDAPDADGWCQLEGTASPQSEALMIYIELKPSLLKTSVILDDASLQPADGMSALEARRPEPVDEATQQRVSSRLEWLRKHRWYGRAPARSSER